MAWHGMARHGINFKRKRKILKYIAAAVYACVCMYWLCRGYGIENEEKLRTIPTLRGVVYQTHLQCNEHTVNIGKESINECKREECAVLSSRREKDK